MSFIVTLKPIKKLISAILAVLLILSVAALLHGCNFTNGESSQAYESSPYASFREIPGLTDGDIEAIERLLEKTEYFTYGMAPDTEAFIDEHGEISGFTPLVCAWLTELFGVPFIPSTYTWSGLFAGLDDGSIDFTGELTPSEARRQTYLMTDPIALRNVKYFYIEGSPTIAEIKKTRLPRYVLQADSTVTDDVLHYAGETFEPIFANDLEYVYEMLLSGEADAFVAEDVAEAFFEELGGVFVEDFVPRLYSPVSLSTQNRELAPIINAVQKALEDDCVLYLSMLHEQGYREYLTYKMNERLTDDEREFIRNNPIIPYGAENDNYPKSFYNEHSGRWEGIAHDVLEEVEILSGLQFQIKNDNQTDFYDLLEMLRTGEIYMLTEVLRSPEREGEFLWPEAFLLQDKLVLISESSLPYLHVKQIYTVSVGIPKESLHEEYFSVWFPGHPNLITYDSVETAFDDLVNGKVDMVFSSYSTLRYLTNYRERPEFKANIIFDNTFDSTFGINAEQELLRSIMDKALALIDTTAISEHWMQKTYDYRLREATARLPLVLAVVALVSLAAILIAILLLRSYSVGKRLEKIVEVRTKELAAQTAMLKRSYEYASQLSDALSTITNSALIFEGELKAAADVVTLEAGHALNTHRVSVWEVLEDKSALRCISCYDTVSGGFIEQEDFDLSARGEYKEKIETERLLAVADMKSGSYQIQTNGYGKNLCATLDAPIRVSGKTVGIVCAEQDKCAEYPRRREWQIEEQDFASSLADIMALAILGIEHRKARDEAQIANMAKSIFLANMSHEIRTPMNVILGITEILMQEDNLPDDIDEGLCRINGSCNMLLGIINDILDFSKIEAGKMDIVPAEYILASVINDSIQLNMMRHEGNNVEFVLNIDENLPEKLIGDELRIKQILNNLLSNAFKYTEDGVITLSISFEAGQSAGGEATAGQSAGAVEAGQPAGAAGQPAGSVEAGEVSAGQPEAVLLTISVQDTGFGMTKQQIDGLFQEYTSFNRVQGRTIEGTGLGLTITRRLAKLMDGEVSVQSEYGKGSLFVVQLKQLKVDDKVLGKEVVENLCSFRTNYMSLRKKTQILRDPMPYGRVLVVDDMESNLYVAIGLMRPYGLRLDTALTGREAVDKIKSGEVYDVIFMDHMMPGMDGIEAAKLIRASGYDAPIVALTANVVAGQQGVYLKNGFDEFLSKPIDIRHLNAILNKLVRDKQPPEVIKEARMQEGSQRTAKLFSNKTVAGIDIQKGLERYSYDEETYLSILYTYSRSVREVLTAIEAIDEENVDGYRVYVHGIKGSSYDIFATEIGDCAKELEMAAMDGDMAFLRANNPIFIKALQTLVNDIDELMRVIDEENPKPEKEFPDIDELFNLLAACKTYKMKDIDDSMTKILKFKYTDDDGLIDRLKESYAKMDFPQMVAILTEWRD